jgi:hypothetical protein
MLVNRYTGQAAEEAMGGMKAVRIFPPLRSRDRCELQ